MEDATPSGQVGGARCALCGRRSACGGRPPAGRRYPQCFRLHAPTTVAHVGAWWDEVTPAEGQRDRRLAALRDAVIGRFAQDRLRFANAFEPSASWDGARWRWLRWSYGFPGWGEDAAREEARLLALAGAFLGRAEETLGPLLRLAGRPEVELPVLGFAYDDPAAWRLKLYLVFREEAGAGAWEIAARALGLGLVTEPTGALHMVGVDLGPRGDRRGRLGGRLYERVPEGWRLERPGAGALRGRPLPGALLVRRVGDGESADASALPRPRDAHIPLEPAELLQTLLGAVPLFAAALRSAPDRAPWAPPEAATRWVAVPLEGAAPVTVYYVLRAP